MWNPEGSQATLPVALRPLLNEVAQAYEEWQAAEDDAFGEDWEIEARRSLQETLGVFAAGAARVGMGPQEIVALIQRNFPDAPIDDIFDQAEDDEIPDPPTYHTYQADQSAAQGGTSMYGAAQYYSDSMKCASCGAGVPVGHQFCPKCGARMAEPSTSDLLAMIQGLQAEVRDLRTKSAQSPAVPRTNLLSDNFITRAFAVYGHTLAAGLMLAIPFYIVIIILGAMFSFAAGDLFW